MAEPYGLIHLLSDEEMQRIHEGALHILRHTGVRVDHDELLALLEDHGCAVNHGQRRVRFPGRIVEQAWERMHRYSVDATGFPPTHEPRSGAGFGVRTGGFTTVVRGLDDVQRSGDLETSRQAIRLADALPYISHVGIPVSPQEIPPQTRTVRMAAELVKITAKPGTVEAWTRREIQWLWEMAVVARGGEEAAREHPILVGYVGLRTPLCLDYAMAEVLSEYSRRGIPYMLYSMPCWSSSAPATMAGTVVLGIAEVLSGLVIGQAVHEDAKPLIFVAPGALDMRSMLMDVSSPTRLNLSVASTQMISRFYGLPCAANCGKTAACDTGVQAGYEKAISILYPILAGATSVGPVGQVANGLAFSFRQLVIDHEIAVYVKHLLRGMEVTEDTLALEVIDEVGPGGDFLALPHTAAHFRQGLWTSDVSESMSYQAWLSEPHRGAEAKALEKARTILERHDRHPLSPEQEAEIDRIVARSLAEIA